MTYHMKPFYLRTLHTVLAKRQSINRYANEVKENLGTIYRQVTAFNNIDASEQLYSDNVINSLIISFSTHKLKLVAKLVVSTWLSAVCLQRDSAHKHF